MKPLTAFFAIVWLGCSLTAATDLEGLLSTMAGQDYDARQEARNELYSMAAHVTSTDSDGASSDLSDKLLDAIKTAALDQQGKVFLTRILARIGTENSASGLFALAMDSGQSDIVREHSVMALTAIPGKRVTDLLLKGLASTEPGNRGLWLQAIQHQAVASDAADIIKTFRKLNLETNPQAWIAIGKIGGPEAAGYLYGLMKGVDGARRASLERAVLDSEGCSVSQLREIMKSSSDKAVQTGAFEQLLQKDGKAALAELKASLGQDPSPLRQRMIRLSLEMGGEAHWDIMAKSASQLAPREIDTVLACVREQGRTEYEELVIKYLEVGDPATQKEALRTLADVGTRISTAALLERMDSGDDDLDDLAIYALSQIKDPELDEQIIEALRNPGSENRAEMIRLVAVRNSDGAAALLNSILLAGADDPDLDDILQSVEEIGDANSCRILLSRILDDLPRSELRAYQLCLKRLTIRLSINDHLWDNAYHPALQLASSDSIRAAIVEILDCLSTDKALEYCTNLTRPDKPDTLKNAATAALKRWTRINSADHWLEIVTDGDAGKSAKQEAKSALVRLIRASAVEAESREKAQLALDMMLEVDDKAFTEDVLNAVASDNGLKRQFNGSIETYRDIISVWETID